MDTYAGVPADRGTKLSLLFLGGVLLTSFGGMCLYSHLFPPVSDLDTDGIVCIERSWLVDNPWTGTLFVYVGSLCLKKWILQLRK